MNTLSVAAIPPSSLDGTRSHYLIGMLRCQFIDSESANSLIEAGTDPPIPKPIDRDDSSTAPELTQKQKARDVAEPMGHISSVPARGTHLVDLPRTAYAPHHPVPQQFPPRVPPPSSQYHPETPTQQEAATPDSHARAHIHQLSQLVQQLQASLLHLFSLIRSLPLSSNAMASSATPDDLSLSNLSL